MAVFARTVVLASVHDIVLNSILQSSMDILQKVSRFSNVFCVNAHKRAGMPRRRVLRSRPCADADFTSVRGGGTPERVRGRDGNKGSL